VATLAGCGPTVIPRSGQSTAASNAERGYAPPPQVLSAVRTADGHLLISGTAPGGSRVRLATPAGDATFATADAGGAWRLEIPQAGEVRLFGLSATTAGRTTQAEGYMVVAPGGEVAQLRSGSGARVLVKRSMALEVLNVDFDRKGGAVVSGMAPAGAPVAVQIDDKTAVRVKASSEGRFILPLNEPLRPGLHAIAAASASSRAEQSLEVSSAPKPQGGPFGAQPVPGGWRVDWLTPGGGIQSTILYGPRT
jgi:hypothetical protein